MYSIVVTLLVGVFFFAVGILLQFRQVNGDEKAGLLKRGDYFKKQFRFLWIVTNDLSEVARLLATKLEATQRELELAREHIDEANARISAANAAFAQLQPAGMPGEAVAGSGVGEIELIASLPTSDASAEVGRARRVVADMMTLASIWRGDFKLKNGAFCLNEMIKSDLAPFRENVLLGRSDVEINFASADSVRVISDFSHVSRCFRAVTSQAIRQSKGGSITVTLTRHAPVLSRKSLIEISVVDSSRRPASMNDSYSIDPVHFRSNAFLCDEPSAMLRLSIAAYTMEAMGGKLAFTMHKQGNMTFTLRFPADLAPE